VEVLVEEELVAPPGVALHPLVAAEDRPAAVRAGEEDGHQPAGQVVRHGRQIELIAGAGRVLQ
jgi:hypothetical protein